RVAAGHGSSPALRPLPTIMRECAVCLGHTMSVFALLDRVSAAVACIEEFGRKPFGHRLFVAFARCRYDPANPERLTTAGTHFDWNLIGCPTNPAGSHFNGRHDVLERLLEHRDRALPGLALDEFQGAIDDSLRHRFFARAHDGIHELRNHQVSVFWIRIDLAFFGTVSAGHLVVLCVAKTNDPITWVVLPHIWSASVYGSSPLGCRARRAGCDSAPREGLSLAHRESSPLSVPAGYDPLRECTRSPRNHS